LTREELAAAWDGRLILMIWSAGWSEIIRRFVVSIRARAPSLWWQPFSASTRRVVWLWDRVHISCSSCSPARRAKRWTSQFDAVAAQIQFLN